MRRVMRMDLIFNKNALLVNYGIFGAFFVYMIFRGPDTPIVFAVFGSLMVSFLPAMIVTREDKFKAVALVCSLPVDRRTIVRARYALGLLMAASGLLVAWVLASWVPGSVMRPGLLFSQGPILTACFVTVTLISLLLPFTLRFGALGLLLALAGFQVVGIILFTVVQRLGSSVDNRVAERIVQGILTVREALGSTGFTGLLVLCLLCLLALSVAVSERVFESRTL